MCSFRNIKREIVLFSVEVKVNINILTYYDIKLSYIESYESYIVLLRSSKKSCISVVCTQIKEL